MGTTNLKGNLTIYRKIEDVHTLRLSSFSLGMQSRTSTQGDMYREMLTK